MEPGTDLTVTTFQVGPKLAALTRLQRNWVLAKAANPSCTDEAAGRIAGYKGNTQGLNAMGQENKHHPKVLEAMKEVAESMLASNVLLAAQAQTEILVDTGHKDRAKISEITLARAGLGVVHQSRVTHMHADLTGQALVNEVARLATSLGWDPQEVLAKYGAAVDADFTVIEPGGEFEFDPE